MLPLFLSISDPINFIELVFQKVYEKTGGKHGQMKIVVCWNIGTVDNFFCFLKKKMSKITVEMLFVQ